MISTQQKFLANRIVCLFFVTILSGCSSSGGNDNSNEITIDNPTNTDVVTDTLPNAPEPIDQNPTNADDVTDPLPDAPGSIDQSPTNADDVTDTLPGAPDPIIQNTTRVTFDITVPAYQSNSLQLRLNWGDIAITADWVGDEFWSVSDDFPTNTVNPLSITFFYDNGSITIASFETSYRTGNNAAETLQVGAEQFVIDRWDDDGDGISNLDELMSGTDPFFDENDPREIRDSYDLPSVQRVSRKYDASIPADRPYFESAETRPAELIRPYSILTTTINIDENGNGNFLDSTEVEGTNDRFGSSESGIRTHLGNRITWVGRTTSFDSGAGRSDSEEFTITTTYLDEQTRTQDGSIVVDNCCGTFNRNEEINYSLTGQVINDSTECEPITGTYRLSAESFGSSGVFTVSASKIAAERHWAVTITRNDIVEEEFLARELDTTFYCNFTDLG